MILRALFLTGLVVFSDIVTVNHGTPPHGSISGIITGLLVLSDVVAVNHDTPPHGSISGITQPPNETIKACQSHNDLDDACWLGSLMAHQ